MLHLNEDINDELFRDAGKNYPLKTGSPDFNAVLNKMNADNKATAIPEEKKRKKYLLLLLLLLLLPALLIIIEKRSSPAHDASTATNTKSAGGNDIDAVENPPAASTATTAGEPGKQGNDQAVNTVTAPIPSGTASANNTILSSGKPSIKNHPNNFPGNNNNTAPFNKTGLKQSRKMNYISLSANDDNNDPATAAGSKHRYASKGKAAMTTGGGAAGDDGYAASEPKQIHAVKAPPLKDRPTVPVTEEPLTVSAPVTPKDENKTAPVKMPADPKPEENIVAKEDKRPGVKKSNPKQKHFYAGVIAGPDLSTVKSQKIKHAGYSYGVIAGYKLSKKLSLETGFLQEKKYYNTEGKYFNTDKLSIPMYVNIQYAQGSCMMSEIPLNIRYTFSGKRRSIFFATAGMSSYFMKSESYDFQLKYNNYFYPKSFSYTRKSTGIFNVVNLSAGYTHPIGRIGDLRIEPYIKLPVGKIGTGSLPIRSAGIYVGVTKNIF